MKLNGDEKIKWISFIDIPNLITMIVAIILFVCSLFVPVNPLYIPQNDSLSDFPYPGKETISTVVCAVIVFGVGLVIIIAMFFLSLKFNKFFNQYNPFTACYIFITTVVVTNICVNVFKSYVGRARPDFYDRCGPYATYYNCTALSKSELNDEFKSFPSGHSATSMSGFIFIALFVQKLVKVRKLWVTLISCLFILLGFYIGATRIRDYKHHPDDVIGGFFVGLLFTFVIWERTYKSIFQKTKKNKKVANADQTQP